MKEFLQKARISPLHTHTVYSVLDGASTIDEYIDWCKKTGAPGLGITDHGWAIGALELVTKCNKAGVTPLPGVEFYIAPDADYQAPQGTKVPGYMHLTAWAINETGYRNLIKLASISWSPGVLESGPRKKDGTPMARVMEMWGGRQQKPRITFDELFAHNEGLVLGSGCLVGTLSRLMLMGDFQGAERNLSRLLEVFKGRLWMEVMPHACAFDYSREKRSFEANAPLSFHECVDFDPSGKRQVAVNNQIIKLARKHGLPLLMTVDSHFVKPEQKKLQDVLLSSSDGGWTFYESYHMLDTVQCAESWAKLHGWDSEQKKIFQEAIEQNDVIVSLAQGMKIEDPFRQPEPEFPSDLIDLSKNDPGAARKAMLMRAVMKHGRMQWDNPMYVERLQKEIDVICDNGILDFSDYFIFLESEISWGTDHSIFFAPGRGSAAGSLLAYCLKITHLNPIEWNLPFERFLSHARLKRSKFPDVDVDSGSRDVLIAHLREKYGNKIAQASTLGTLKLKSAIKDACRAILGLNAQDPVIDALCKTIPNEPQGVSSRDFLLGYKDQDGEMHDGHLMQNQVLDDFFQKYPSVYDAVMQLLGIPRSVGRHASAFLISNAPISDTVPTCMISGVLCTQYQATANNNMVEKAGLIKFDFLRVNTLDDISNCVRLVQKNRGYRVWEESITLDGESYRITKGDLGIDKLPLEDGTILDLYQLPEDPNVFAELSAGRTETVFQMNSALMTGQTKRIRPTKLRHLSDIVALVRPGPLLADTGVKDPETGKSFTMTELYIAAKNGRVKPTYAHPDMKPILEETYGSACYQEQLQQMFVDLAGYSLEDADYLREVLAKKKRQEMEKAIPELRQRLSARGWSEQQQDVFVSLCIASSAYSFNKSHSAAYAMVAYQCAYLKHHFPIEWWTAVLQNAKVEDIREKGYAQTLQAQGILELPSVNGPTDTFRPVDGKVLAPLYIIDGIGDIACREIEERRKSGGIFKSFQDFFERVDSRKINKEVVHNLILCNTFREIEPSKSVQELIREYHYLRKVTSLKIGRDKTGLALAEAVSLYKSVEAKKGKTLEEPFLYKDPFMLEVLRLHALPIYRSDLHRDFKEMLRNKLGILYGEKETTVRDPGESNHPIPVYHTLQDIRENCDSGSIGAFLGVIQSEDIFSFTDRRSNKKVNALKLQVSNDGESIEAVVWPDQLEKFGPPGEAKVVLVIGRIKESREPGKWEMSTSYLQYVE